MNSVPSSLRRKKFLVTTRWARGWSARSTRRTNAWRRRRPVSPSSTKTRSAGLRTEPNIRTKGFVRPRINPSRFQLGPASSPACCWAAVSRPSLVVDTPPPARSSSFVGALSALGDGLLALDRFRVGVLAGNVRSRQTCGDSIGPARRARGLSAGAFSSPAAALGSVGRRADPGLEEPPGGREGREITRQEMRTASRPRWRCWRSADRRTLSARRPSASAQTGCAFRPTGRAPRGPCTAPSRWPSTTRFTGADSAAPPRPPGDSAIKQETRAEPASDRWNRKRSVCDRRSVRHQTHRLGADVGAGW